MKKDKKLENDKIYKESEEARKELERARPSSKKVKQAVEETLRENMKVMEILSKR